jgi:hypothetical protein
MTANVAVERHKTHPRRPPASVHSYSQEVVVGIGVSLILIAVGAVLAFAVHVTTSGFNVNTVGYILLIVGAIGALLSLMFWSSWGGVGGRRTVVEERGPARRRTVVEDEVVQ